MTTPGLTVGPPDQSVETKLILAGQGSVGCCTVEHECFYCEQAINPGDYYRDGGDGNRIHERCHFRGYEDRLQSVEHEFLAQSFGSTYCRCGQSFDAPPHNYKPSVPTLRESPQSIAEDLLEWLEYDIAEERQQRAEEYW